MHDNVSGQVRPAAVAGQFYSGDAASLRDELTAAFTSPLGPGAAPAVGTGPRRLLGLVVPHAGYIYSGPGAAWGYAAAARDGRPTTAVILGVNHHMLGAFGSALALSSATGWETPLGVMPVATELGRALRDLDAEVVIDDVAHAYEHSLEVQVPFLQYVFGELPILPIVIADATREAVFRLGEALATLAREQDLLLIASTDFSHQVPQETAAAQDHHALDAITRVDAAGLLDVVAARRISMCGYMPTAAVLTAARALGITHGEVLHYHTSGDVIGDRRRVVGYGTAALYRPES